MERSAARVRTKNAGGQQMHRAKGVEQPPHRTEENRRQDKGPDPEQHVDDAGRRILLDVRPDDQCQQVHRRQHEAEHPQCGACRRGVGEGRQPGWEWRLLLWRLAAWGSSTGTPAPRRTPAGRTLLRPGHSGTAPAGPAGCRPRGPGAVGRTRRSAEQRRSARRSHSRVGEVTSPGPGTGAGRGHASRPRRAPAPSCALNSTVTGLPLLRMRLHLGIRGVHVQLAGPVGGHDERDLLAGRERHPGRHPRDRLAGHGHVEGRLAGCWWTPWQTRLGSRSPLSSHRSCRSSIPRRSRAATARAGTARRAVITSKTLTRGREVNAIGVRRREPLGRTGFMLGSERFDDMSAVPWTRASSARKSTAPTRPGPGSSSPGWCSPRAGAVPRAGGSTPLPVRLPQPAAQRPQRQRRVATTTGSLGTYLTTAPAGRCTTSLPTRAARPRATALVRRIWPPLLTTGAATASGGADAGKLGTTKRTDGTTQVTYGGHPLYTYAADSAKGETKGQGVNATAASGGSSAPTEPRSRPALSGSTSAANSMATASAQVLGGQTEVPTRVLPSESTTRIWDRSGMEIAVLPSRSPRPRSRRPTSLRPLAGRSGRRR